MALGAVLAAVAFGTLAIVASSRAGAAALLLATLVVAWRSVTSATVRRVFAILAGGYLLVMVLLAAALAASSRESTARWTWLPESVRNRWAQTSEDFQLRLQSSGVALKMFARSPLAGVGLGAYGEVAPAWWAGREVMLTSRTTIGPSFAVTPA